jgi:hypothetical protein
MKRIGLLIACVILLTLIAACSAGEPSYSAHVWEDLDGDGMEGEEEPALEGIVVQIINQSSGLLWMRTETDQEGNTFPFRAGGSCGQYAVYINVPEGYWPTTPVVTAPPSCETVKFGLKEGP